LSSTRRKHCLFLGIAIKYNIKTPIYIILNIFIYLGCMFYSNKKNHSFNHPFIHPKAQVWSYKFKFLYCDPFYNDIVEFLAQLLHYRWLSSTFVTHSKYVIEKKVIKIKEFWVYKTWSYPIIRTKVHKYMHLMICKQFNMSQESSARQTLQCYTRCLIFNMVITTIHYSQ